MRRVLLCRVLESSDKDQEVRIWVVFVRCVAGRVGLAESAAAEAETSAGRALGFRRSRAVTAEVRAKRIAQNVKRSRRGTKSST